MLASADRCAAGPSDPPPPPPTHTLALGDALVYQSDGDFDVVGGQPAHARRLTHFVTARPTCFGAQIRERARDGGMLNGETAA
jgi:hypothetical protein